MPKNNSACSRVKEVNDDSEEEIIESIKPVKEKKKRTMTPEMLATLQRAREKAIEVKKAIATPDKRLEHYKEKIKTVKAKERVSRKELMKQAIREVEEEVAKVVLEPTKSLEVPIKEVPIKEVPKPEEPIILEPVKPKKKMVKYIYQEETDSDEDRVVVIKKPKEPKPKEVVPLKPLMKPPVLNPYAIFGNRR